MESLPVSTPPTPGDFLDDRGVVIEDLGRIRLGAPGGGLPGVGQQILDAVRNALQGAAVALALEFLIDILRLLQRFLREGSASAL